jgi:hypothetical protein
MNKQPQTRQTYQPVKVAPGVVFILRYLNLIQQQKKAA